MRLNYKWIKVIFLMIFEVYADSDLWIIVKVGNKFLETDGLSQDLKVNRKTSCGSLCSKMLSCNIWCHYEKTKCILISTIVSPSYKETSQDFLECYTRKRRDIVVGSDTYSYEPESPDTKSELAADGIYSQNHGKHFLTKYTRDPWVIFDLKQSANIYEIIIKTKVKKLCGNLFIKIGRTLVEDGNFTTYRQLYSVFDLCNYDDEYIHFKSAKPLEGRYVAVIRYDIYTVLWFNHIEIDGEFIDN